MQRTTKCIGLCSYLLWISFSALTFCVGCVTPSVAPVESPAGSTNWEASYNASVKAVEQGRYIEAEKQLSKALKLARKSGDYQQLVPSLVSLGALHYILGRDVQVRYAHDRYVQDWEDLIHAHHNRRLDGRVSSARMLLTFRAAHGLLTFGVVGVTSSPYRYRYVSRAYNTDVTYSLFRYANGADFQNKRIQNKYVRDKYEQAEKIYNQALKTLENTLGPDHPDVAVVLYNLAGLYDAQEKRSKAESLSQRALGILERAHSGDAVAIATNLRELADQYNAENMVLHAERLYRQALQILEKSPDSTPSDHIPVIGGLGEVYAYQGKYDQAEAQYRLLLKLVEQALGQNHPEVAAVLIDLARFQVANSNTEGARSARERALHILKASLTLEDAQVIADLNTLANDYMAQGDSYAAESVYKQTLEILSDTLGSNHPHSVAILNGLAELYISKGEFMYGEAERFSNRALQLLEKSPNSSPTDLALTLSSQIVFYVSREQYARVERMYDRLLAQFNQSLGLYHPSTVLILNVIADYYHARKRVDVSNSMYADALDIWERTEHFDVASDLNQLAWDYTAEGRYHHAEPLYQRSLEIIEKLMGKYHPDIAMICYDMALFYGKQGRYTDAEELFKRAIDIFDKHLGMDHPLLAVGLNGLADIYRVLPDRNLSRFQKAKRYYKQWIKKLEQQVGPVHVSLAIALEGYAKVLRALKDPEATKVEARAEDMRRRLGVR